MLHLSQQSIVPLFIVVAVAVYIFFAFRNTVTKQSSKTLPVKYSGLPVRHWLAIILRSKRGSLPIF